MKNIIIKLFNYIANFVPTTNIILFHSFPDCSDNSYAMCKYLSNERIYKYYKLVWLVNDKSKIKSLEQKLKEEGINACFVKRVSVKGVWKFLRARYVFVTHGLFDAIKLHQHDDKIINLWHGMPLKLVGALEDRGIPCSSNFNYTIATSRFYQKAMSKAFATSMERVLVIGQPRCDLLFEKTDWFDNINIDTSNYHRIGMWMPTYRKSICGDIRIDGCYNEYGVSFLSENDMQRLDLVLQETKTLLLLKIHPMDVLQNSNFSSFKNIILIKPQDFKSQLYPLLGACDFLLTDYSSVYIDYMILQKPIGFVMNDIDEYNNSRGFYFEDLKKALPGPILSNFDSLVEFIKSPYSIPVDVEYNNFFDNCSAERIAKFLKLC